MKKTFIIGALCALMLTACGGKETSTVNTINTINTGKEMDVVSSSTTTTETLEIVSALPEISEPSEYMEVEPAIVTYCTEHLAVETVSCESIEKLTFRVSAYCACSICCGKWANNRPIDENGNPIVYGAAGKPLTGDVSCASPLPFGTEIDLDDIGTVVVEDRTAKWVVNKYGQYIIDLYMTDHQKAREFGVRYIEGVIK